LTSLITSPVLTAGTPISLGWQACLTSLITSPTIIVGTPIVLGWQACLTSLITSPLIIASPPILLGWQACLTNLITSPTLSQYIATALLTVSSNGGGHVAVVVGSTELPLAGSYNIPVGSYVSIAAEADTGYRFLSWWDSEGHATTQNPYSFTMGGAAHGFVASFESPPPPSGVLVPSEPSGYAVHAWYRGDSSGAWYDSMYFYQYLASDPNIDQSRTEGAFASGTTVTLSYP
jgi:hypothetical protein